MTTGTEQFQQLKSDFDSILRNLEALSCVKRLPENADAKQAGVSREDERFLWNGQVRKSVVIASSGGGGHLAAAAAKQKAYVKLQRKYIARELHNMEGMLEQIREMIKAQPQNRHSVDQQFIDSMIGRAEKSIVDAKQLINATQDDELDLVQHNVLKDWVPFAMYWVNKWNNAQKAGDIATQEEMAPGYTLVDVVVIPFTFMGTLISMLKNDTDVVICTQGNAIRGITLAVRFVNWLRRHEIENGDRPPARVDLVMTEVPNKLAQNYLQELRENFSDNDRAVLRLLTTDPLTEPGQTEAEFWAEQLGNYHMEGEKGTGIEVCKPRMPIRDAFYDKELLSRDNIHQNGFDVKTNNQDERDALQTLIDKGLAHESDEGVVNIQISPNDKLQTAILGSQGGRAVMEYIEHTITHAQESNAHPGEQMYFYVFCGRHEQDRDDLFAKVTELLEERRDDIPKNLHILPMGFHDDKLIAPLLARTDVDIRRAGGMSAMEAMQIFKEVNPNARVLIQSEQDPELVDKAETAEDKYEILMTGYPGWERGNAEYLIGKIDAMPMNPKLFGEHMLSMANIDDAHSGISKGVGYSPYQQHNMFAERRDLQVPLNCGQYARHYDNSEDSQSFVMVI